MRTSLTLLIGALAMGIGAQISVPMVPVPTTLQTLVLFAFALRYGPWRGGAMAALYLALVLLDLPVLSSAQRHGGLRFLEFAAAGYVVAFVPGAMLAGWLGQGSKLRGALACLLGHGVVLAVGTAVLSRWIGVEDAVAKGLTPFLLGALVKSALAPWLAQRAAASAPSADPRA